MLAVILFGGVHIYFCSLQFCSLHLCPFLSFFLSFFLFFLFFSGFFLCFFSLFFFSCFDVICCVSTVWLCWGEHPTYPLPFSTRTTRTNNVWRRIVEHKRTHSCAEISRILNQTSHMLCSVVCLSVCRLLLPQMHLQYLVLQVMLETVVSARTNFLHLQHHQAWAPTVGTCHAVPWGSTPDSPTTTCRSMWSGKRKRMHA